MKYLLSIAVLACVMVACTQPSQPPASSPSSLRFVVLADSRGKDHGINSDIVRNILAKIKNLNPQPEFAVIPGDLVEGSEVKSELRSQLHYFKKTITEYYPIEFYHLGIGNHETTHYEDGEKLFAEIFPEIKGSFLDGYNHTVYFFDHGNTRFFMLNNDHPGEFHCIAQSQLNWINENIDPQKAHTVFFMHEPSYPTGYHIGESMDADPLLRNQFWDMVDSLKSAIVFNGHEHFYSRRHINREYNETINGKKFEYENEVYQVTIGGFGGPLGSNFVDKPGVDVPPIGEYHFAIVDISDKGMEITVKNLDGKQLDHFFVP